MTQLYNSKNNRLVNKKRYPVAAVGRRPHNNSSHRSVSWRNEGYVPDDIKQQRGERPLPYNLDGKFVCYACGKEGHIAKECKSFHSKGPDHSSLSQTLSSIQSAITKLSAENVDLQAAISKMKSNTTSRSA
uniref:CCHC-type domain-containing protein n=1 Tax=Anguilla anguilla TaxID=7936 RepID=A0A0E9WUD2_ANGAN